MGSTRSAAVEQLITIAAAQDQLAELLARVERDRLRTDEQKRIDAEGKRTPKRARPLCGARTRAGGSCEARVVWDRLADRPKNGRCRLHGGAVPRDEERHDAKHRAAHPDRLAVAATSAPSPQAEAAHGIYLALSPPRSLRAVARACHLPLATVERWATAWSARADRRGR
jgi:hypothetical protein